ncbi:MAG TPA: hypothetical protein VHL09_14990 [Dehalococcoidia bacterium]|nr:hypothetical protein [Dehalococcoidia bacterium]
MDQQQAQQIEQVLRPNWRQIRYRILDQFAQVSTSDLDSAVNVNDLVQRIADKTHHSERYVETRLQELVGVGAAAGQQAGLQAGQPFGMQAGQQQLGQQAGQQQLGAQGAQQTAGQPAGQPFGASAQ